MKPFALITLTFLTLTSCQIFNNSGVKKYYSTNTEIIENADLFNYSEIDTGQYTLLYYCKSYNVPHVIDEEFFQVVFFKIQSLDILPLNKVVSIPDSSIYISSYFWSIWSFREQNNLSGNIERIEDMGTTQKIRIHLSGCENGKNKKLVNGLYEFETNTYYFSTTKVEYGGEYNNLRIALKEPEKVIKLDMSMAAVWDYHKNGINSRISGLPEEIAGFVNLEVLDLSLCGYNSLQPEVGRFQKLRILNLGYNDFTEFPTEILTLENLDSLNMEHCHLTAVPLEIANLKNLTKLNLDYNRLTGFPEGITNLINLTSLSMRGDSITTIPKEIVNLTKLEKLDLSSFFHYPGKNRPQNIEVLAGLKNLRELYMEFDGLTSLPDEFSQLVNLEVLNIKFNKFTSFPAVIDKLPNLKLLIISHCEFDEGTMNELRLQKKKYKVQIDNI